MGEPKQIGPYLFVAIFSENVTQLQQLITHTTRWTLLTLTAALDNNTEQKKFPSLPPFSVFCFAADIFIAPKLVTLKWLG